MHAWPEFRVYLVTGKKKKAYLRMEKKRKLLLNNFSHVFCTQHETPSLSIIVKVN